MRLQRPALLAGATIAAVIGIAVLRNLDADREYRRLLVDGEQALDAGNPLGAVESFTKALALRPASMVGRYRRGEAHAALAHYDDALEDLTEARRLAPEAREPIEALGRLADLRGRPAEAAAWYAEAANRLTVADPRLLHALALARYRAGTPAAAIEPLKRALTRDPSMAEAHFLLGLAARDAGQPDVAAVALEQSVRLAPAHLASRVELADLYQAQGRTTDEVAVRRALAALDPSADRYVDLAMANLRARREDDALAALAQAESADRSSSRVALALGRLHLAEAERTADPAAARRALTALERALGGTARRSEGLALYGRALYLAGDTTGAERLLRDAVRTSPVDAEAFSFLADAAERLGHHGIARDALVRLAALEGDTTSRDVRASRLRRIGTLSLALGDPPTAVDYLQRALKSGEADAGLLGLVARARWQSGDHAGARDALGQALALNDRDPDLRRLARQIR